MYDEPNDDRTSVKWLIPTGVKETLACLPVSLSIMGCVGDLGLYFVVYIYHLSFALI